MTRYSAEFYRCGKPSSLANTFGMYASRLLFANNISLGCQSHSHAQSIRTENAMFDDRPPYKWDIILSLVLAFCFPLLSDPSLAVLV